MDQLDEIDERMSYLEQVTAELDEYSKLVADRCAKLTEPQ